MDNIKLSAAFIMAHSEVYQVCKRHFDYQNQKTKEFVEAEFKKTIIYQCILQMQKVIQ